LTQLLAQDALELVSKWLRQTISSIPPGWLVLIAILLVTVFVIGLVKRIMAVVITITILVVVVIVMWIYAGPAANATSGLNHGRVTTLGTLVGQHSNSR